MEIALPDYRERLGGAIHESTPYLDHDMRSRFDRVFPEGYFTPLRIGHIVMALTDEPSPVAYPFVPQFNTVDGVAQNVDNSQHSNLSKDIIKYGFGLTTELLLGYIWENPSQGSLPYAVALTNFKFVSKPQAQAVALLTGNEGFLFDHDIFIGYRHGMRYKTYRCVGGELSEHVPGKMPEEMQHEIFLAKRDKRLAVANKQRVE